MKNILSIVLFATAIGIGAAHSGQTQERPIITVFKTPWCGCCQVWVEAMQETGHDVDATDVQDLSGIKRQAGVPNDLEACHTSVIGGDRKYVLEGHVPIEAVEKLMAEQPNVKGISTPGMPMGSLGMGYDPDARYTVYSFTQRSGEKPAVFYQAGQK